MLGDTEAAAAVAAGRVPPQISLSYLEQERDGPAMDSIIFMFVLTLVIVNGRTFSRLYLRKVFGIDDILAVISTAMFIAFVPLCIILINIGSGRHFAFIQYVMTEDILEETEVLDFTAHLVYTSALLFCRYSGLAFYYRVCGSHNRFLLAIKGAAFFLLMGYLTQMLLIIFHCIPVTALWPYDFERMFDRYQCIAWGLVYGINSAVSLVCDFVLFGIPVAMLRMLDMTRKRKIQLACILLPGVVVVAISIARLLLVINGQLQVDKSWIYSPLLATEVAEIGATLIALSIPGFRPLANETYTRTRTVLNRWFPRVFPKRRRDRRPLADLWYETPPWQLNTTAATTPVSAEFKARDIEGALRSLEMNAIPTHKSPEKALASPWRTMPRRDSANLWMFEDKTPSPTERSKNSLRRESANLWMFEDKLPASPERRDMGQFGRVTTTTSPERTGMSYFGRAPTNISPERRDMRQLGRETTNTWMYEEK